MKRLFILAIACNVFMVSAQHETGVGARAFALANNHVALSSGIADLYWNPATLAFSVSREFQASLYGTKLSSTSDFFGNSASKDLQRFKLGNAGFSFALPTIRGGMSIAGAYSNPWILDDAYVFSGRYLLIDSLYSVNRSYRGFGSLNYWTMGFGMQIIRNLGIGVSASLVTGKEAAEVYLRKLSLDDPASDPFIDDYQSDNSYVGYDLRAGLFYKSGIFNAGMRLIAPQVVRYKDYLNGTYGNEPLDATDKYVLYSSYKGALGISAVLPFLTVTAEVRSTLPYDYLFPIEDISGSQSGHFKTGGGIGIEVPLIFMPVIVRAGYSYDQFDLHPWVSDFIEQPDDVRNIEWSDNGMEVNRDLHRIGAGLGYTTASMAFDISYGFSTWGITTKRNLEQIYLLHRVLASFAVRF